MKIFRYVDSAGLRALKSEGIMLSPAYLHVMPGAELARLEACGTVPGDA